VPFEQLVEALLPDRGLAYTPLFQVKLVLQNVPLQASTVGDCQVECIPLDPGTSKFDLQFTMDETPQGLSGILTYNTDIFESPSACRIIAKWLKVMAITAEQSDITITGIKAKLAASVDTSGANVAAKSLGKLKSRRTRGTKKSGKDNG
jgi:non-ribosomal peptide synthetase component F